MCRIRICLYCHKTPESNTEVTAFASIIQDIFRPLKKKKKAFPLLTGSSDDISVTLEVIPMYRSGPSLLMK